jgi:CDP-4-dehydro-6-deoxyglucose reductase
MPEHIITVQNIPGFTFSCQPHETLLQAAERQGIQFPVGCENGLCGTCKGQLIAGKTSYGTQEIYGLTPEEQADKQILFCSAIPEGDCTIEHSGIEIPPQHYEEHATVVDRQSLGPFLTELTLETQTPWVYKPGQYLHVLTSSDSSANLPFSVANAPGTRLLKLHIQILPGQPQESLLKTLIQADHLHLEGPHGNAYLRQSSRPLLLIAGGSGFAPFSSLLEHLIKTNSSREIYLYWGAKKPDRLYAHDRLVALAKDHPKLHYIPVISEPEGIDWSGRIGLVHEAALQDHPTLLSFESYLSGPYEMVKIAKETFVQQGLSPRLLYADMG